MVDLVGELLDERVDAPAEVAVVAGRRRAFEVAPTGVDVVDVVTAGSCSWTRLPTAWSKTEPRPSEVQPRTAM
jgi:hypothetical protein